MSEQKAVRLFRAVTDVGDDMVEEAGEAPHVKKAAPWRRWGAVAACVCLAAALGAGIWRWAGTADGPETPGIYDGVDGSDTLTGGSMMLGGFTPVLRVGDTLYKWKGISMRLTIDPRGSYSSVADGSSYLPEGFREYGAISGVTTEEPTEDLQLLAGFEAVGTVFVSKDHPAVVYVLMTTDWFGNAYVRFVSDALGDNQLLTWQGRTYHLDTRNGGYSELVEELPEGCELIGNLHFVGDDAVPTGDLETNCRTDTYGRSINGREAYAVPGDNSVLYVYEHHYWREGDYPAWRACHLWER